MTSFDNLCLKGAQVKHHFKQFSYPIGWAGAAGDLLISWHVLPGGDEGMGRGERGIWKASPDIRFRPLQHGRRLRLPVEDGSFSFAGVNVSQEGGDDREVGGEAVIHVLLLHGKILSWDDSIGGHLERDI